MAGAGVLVCLAAAVPAIAGTAPLTSVADVRALSREEAARGLPVKLRGTVILEIGKGREFRLHDGVESLAVQTVKARDRGLWTGPLPVAITGIGSVVEVEGITDPAGYSPVVVPTAIRKVGMAALPPPLKPGVGELLSGNLVSQLVEIEGVVQEGRRVGNAYFDMEVIIGGFPCEVKVHRDVDLRPEGDGEDVWRVLGAGSTIGHKRLLRFQGMETDQLRLTVEGEAPCLAIARLRLFRTPDYRPDPELIWDRSGFVRIKAGPDDQMFSALGNQPSEKDFSPYKLDKPIALPKGGYVYSNVLHSPVEQTVRFRNPIRARHVRFTALHAIPSNDRASAAEIGLLVL